MAIQMQINALVQAPVMWTAEQLQTKGRSIRTKWSKYHNLLTRQTGWRIDNNIGQIIAPEGAWDAYIDAHPDFANLRDRPLSHYDWMIEMWSGTTASGRYALGGSTQNPVNVDEDLPEDRQGSGSKSSGKRYSRDMASYRNMIYHVPDWQGVELRHPIELFNKRHSSLRNVIDRSFRVLKKRFPILKGTMPSFSIERQVQLVRACCAVHNFIRRHDTPDIYDYPDPRVEEYDLEVERAMTNSEEAEVPTIPEMAVLRDNIALAMWENK